MIPMDDPKTRQVWSRVMNVPCPSGEKQTPQLTAQHLAEMAQGEWQDAAGYRALAVCAPQCARGTLLKLACEKLEKYNMLPANYAPLSTSIANEDLEGMFYDRKIPTILVIGKPIWYHTDHDTPDKVEPEQIYRAMMGHYEMVLEMLRMGKLHLEQTETFGEIILSERKTEDGTEGNAGSD